MDQFQLRNSFVDEINQARTQPRPTAQKIYEVLAPLFREDQLHCFKKTIQTFQGIQALNDLREYLKRKQVVDSLKMSDALCRVAQRIAEEKGLNGRTDHEQPQSIYQKISALAQIHGNVGELISLRGQSGQEVSTYFLMDDGLATRKRRRMLLDPKYRFVGVGTAQHRQYETITVVLLAEEMTELRVSQYMSEQVREPLDVKEMGHSVGNSHLREENQLNLRGNDYHEI